MAESSKYKLIADPSNYEQFGQFFSDISYSLRRFRFFDLEPISSVNSWNGCVDISKDKGFISSDDIIIFPSGLCVISDFAKKVPSCFDTFSVRIVFKVILSILVFFLFNLLIVFL